MNRLNTKVSCFKNYFTEDSPQVINLLTWLKSKKYASTVQQIRAADDKKERDSLKAQLPAITPSGTFSRRQQNNLIKHSGLIQFDIDGHDNRHIGNFSALKLQISKLAEVAYCGLSVSGRGFWGLVPIAYPDKHKLHFQALKEDFRNWDIVLDDAPGNVASLRGYSYDAEGYFNPNAKVYTRLFEPTPQEYRKSYQPNNLTPESKKVEACLQAIEAGRIDITGSYSEWFAIGCALANEFGEAGRDYFHRASQYYPSYDFSKTDKQFSQCLGRNYSTTVATFYHLAEMQGITYKERLQNKPEQPSPQEEPTQAKGNGNKQPPEAQKPSPQLDGLPPGWGYEILPNGDLVLIDEDKLPAVWKTNPKNELEALAIMKELNPALGQLEDVFGLEVEEFLITK